MIKREKQRLISEHSDLLATEIKDNIFLNQIISIYPAKVRGTCVL